MSKSAPALLPPHSLARPSTSRPRLVGAHWLRTSRPLTPPSPCKPAHNIPSPTPSPSPPLPVQPRALSPLSCQSTARYLPSAAPSLPPPPPAHDCPLPHPSHPSSAPISSPTNTGGWPRSRPSSAPRSLAPSYPSPHTDLPSRPLVHSFTSPTRLFPSSVPDPIPSSSSSPESPHSPSSPAPVPAPSRRRYSNPVGPPHKRDALGSAGPGTSRLAHGTVRGHWTGTQLIESLHLLSDTNIQLKFSRMPGSEFPRQLKYRWKGNVVSVNIWHTGRVHLQGRASGDRARRLSELAPSSCTRGRSVSPRSDGDSSGEGNNLSSVSRGLCLMMFWWVFHLVVMGSAP